MVSLRSGAAGAAMVAVMLAGAPAVAQPSGQDVATAQALFDEGKRLMAAGSYAEACPKLLESQRIDPGGGTLYAIALCHEGEGKTATAWADFNVALAEARKDRRTDREAAAAERIRALEPRLTRTRVVVPAARAPGLEIKRDGARVGEAQWGTALPIDPGEHAFEATAQGKRPWRQVVDIRGEGKTIDVAVPALEDEPAAAPPPPPAAAAGPAPPPKETGSPQRTWAFVAGGVGLAAAAVGLGFALSASSKWSEASEACPGGRCTDPADRDKGVQAGTEADLSTVLVTAGAVAVVAGTILWLTAPRASATAASRGPAVLPGAGFVGIGPVAVWR
jgi:serine/threonine-protein kinase